MTENSIDFDGAWKSSLEQYFEPFMAFFFPKAHADIAWARGYEFLDNELQKICGDAAIGRRSVDKLVKLWHHDGREAWILLHLEVQSQYDASFPERMVVYRSRIYDRYRRPIASFAVLGDEQPSWRPDRFRQELWDSLLEFRFPIVKLLDFRQQWPTLEANSNPFASVVMAHLKAQETRYDPNERKAWKLALTRRLYERGYDRQDVLGLFRFIDWLLQLPQALESEFWQNIELYEAQQNMAYITSVERIGIQKGTEQTWRAAIARTLTSRFEAADVQPISDSLARIFDAETLKALFDRALSIDSLDAFQRLIDDAAASGDR